MLTVGLVAVPWLPFPLAILGALALATAVVALLPRCLGNGAITVVELTGIHVILAVSLNLTNGFAEAVLVGSRDQASGSMR